MLKYCWAVFKLNNCRDNLELRDVDSDAPPAAGGPQPGPGLGVGLGHHGQAQALQPAAGLLLRLRGDPTPRISR